jgi:DNA primase
MAFSPRFLDEIKNRAGLAEVVGRRVRLIKKGREFQGLCPFHNEKTPSFTVNEDKGFYHCFGCGEHGSIFDFVMKTSNLSFPESVEQLASELGLEIPAETPEERHRQKRARNLFEVTEAAAVYFENQLQNPRGRAALDYILSRGINEESIKKFRIGFAPQDRDSFKRTLALQGISNELMIDAGLLIKPDDPSRQPYDRFRGRVMFPISDRRSRVIAFGGRILGDGEPKYLNSPETPLFQKGNNLYALPQAVGAAHDNGTVLVAEGYTDVIALHQAGFKNVVAPLGTALTENQMQLLWKVVSEPVLCFDGDGAGQKAARRAAERAMPLLKPGKSLRFIALPDGEDPDSLIKSSGVQAIKAILREPVPLFEMVWQYNTVGCRLETPEDRAGLENRLTQAAKNIADATVQRYYVNSFRNRLWDEFGKKRKLNRFSPVNTNLSGRRVPPVQMAEKSGKDAHIDIIWIQQSILIATLINHPLLFDNIGEQLGSLEFSALDLDKLRQEVLKTLTSNPRLERQALRDHLEDTGFSVLMNDLLSRQVINHANFARPEEDINVALKGWEQTLRLFRRGQLLEEIQIVEKELSENPTNETFELLKALKQTALQREDAEMYNSINMNSKSA